MRAKRFRKHDASVLVDGERVHVTIERDRELVALVRIIRQAVENPVDVLRKSLAACIERRSIERGVAVDAAGVAVAFEDAAERRGHGNPALGVDLVDVRRDKAVHPVARASPDAGHTLARGEPIGPVQRLALAIAPQRARDDVDWACMGLHGYQWVSMVPTGDSAGSGRELWIVALAPHPIAPARAAWHARHVAPASGAC